jgi:protein-L-isoaspartate(D-aspartate) O-methyltransferase
VENTQADDSRFLHLRMEMVETQLLARGIRDERVLQAMGKVPRHLFLNPDSRERAYDDRPVPIGHGQTLSQPYIVAFMTEQLNLDWNDKVLEIGTGSGYQTAVLAELVRRVFTLEIVASLSQSARSLLGSLGYANIEYSVGDGRLGWPQAAPFQAILAAAAAEVVPPLLLEQLSDGGRIILPLGAEHQDLWLVRRSGGELVSQRLLPVRFVPMIWGDSITD